MADNKINTLTLKQYMTKQMEPLKQIEELKKSLGKKDEDVPECMEYLNRMYKACQQVVEMCNEYEEIQKDAILNAEVIKWAKKLNIRYDTCSDIAPLLADSKQYVEAV